MPAALASNVPAPNQFIRLAAQSVLQRFETVFVSFRNASRFVSGRTQHGASVPAAARPVL
jgi:hypothetical protein